VNKRYHFIVRIYRPTLGEGTVKMYVDAPQAWIAWRDLACQYGDIHHATTITLDRVEQLT
jgi:hypothetical protein